MAIVNILFIITLINYLCNGFFGETFGNLPIIIILSLFILLNVIISIRKKQMLYLVSAVLYIGIFSNAIIVKISVFIISLFLNIYGLIKSREDYKKLANKTKITIVSIASIIVILNILHVIILNANAIKLKKYIKYNEENSKNYYFVGLKGNNGKSCKIVDKDGKTIKDFGNKIFLSGMPIKYDGRYVLLVVGVKENDNNYYLVNADYETKINYSWLIFYYFNYLNYIGRFYPIKEDEIPNDNVKHINKKNNFVFKFTE